ncbi:MAG: glutamine--fructose-6-phosphate aminotransferase, partial [Actinomycetota bacterium]|nr:glutamine--fructose-6-phosphate aminotransferase [Actinomycetota bacterium]
MCGIVGISGTEPVVPMLLEALARLEYRGYDSSGVAIVDGATLWRRRRVGKLAELAGAVDDAPATAGTGIGHTRWATHGRPAEHNAHPHTDCTGELAVAHNGIIENHVALADELAGGGHQLQSETDSEVLAHLIEDGLAAGLDLPGAVRAALGRVVGSFALAVVRSAHPDLVVAARRGSPLIAGRSDGMGLVASDIPALLPLTREVYVIDDDQLVEVGPGTLRVTTLAGAEVEPQRRHIDWDLEAAEKSGYPDFMLKEINEQPQAIRETLRDRTRDGRLVLDEVRLSADELRAVDKVFVVGCGTSYHAGLVA